ncbi:MAG: DUF3866 family protein [Clostridiaceae bacterium]|nr:DUF3866 family protein [Clostridiaceae bacterium]
MMSMKKGKVKEIITSTKEKTVICVVVDGKEEKAINYNLLTGDITKKDEVIINTTAIELGLGTGGYHFVIYNLDNDCNNSDAHGHIMKLRYTPFQIKVLAAEEQESPYHHIFHEFESLHQMPVIVGELHSMVTPIVATLKYIDSDIKIAYIMTDGAALPIDFSNSIYMLKSNKLIDATITIGHAFGGDFEAVNIYNGLITAKEIAKCDVAIVTMGPGIVGTGTPYGFTGIEQGYILDAANDLGGSAIGVARISFADRRERHKGISHHSLTVFDKITKTRSNLVIHSMPSKEREVIYKQIKNLKILKKHNIIERDGTLLIDALKKFDLSVKTMGREFNEDKYFFLTCAAAAKYGYSIMKTK